MADKSVNAGVDALIGFELQRNTALSLLLNNYEDKFKDKEYFICIEHHDDFLYCFLNERNEAQYIEVYQSKKKTSNKWSINAELYELLGKILQVGRNLLSDSHPKTKNYKHDLFFVTNQQIELSATIKQHKETSIISERNNKSSYVDLPASLQNRLKKNITPTLNHSELDNLHFMYIDLAKTSKEQKNQLIGQLITLFGDKIVNHIAAIDTMFYLFNRISVIFNQGGIPKLLDKSKRVTSREIEDAFRILTTKTKCFDYWRNNASNITSTLRIKPIYKDSFEADFKEAFDLFKCEDNVLHADILKFSKDNYQLCESYTEHECVNELIEKYKKENNLLIDDIRLKAIFFASYFEVIYKKTTN